MYDLGHNNHKALYLKSSLVNLSYLEWEHDLSVSHLTDQGGDFWDLGSVITPQKKKTVVLEINSLSFHSRLLCRWFWFTEFSCITNSSTNRDDPLKSFCCVPDYIVSMISFLLLYNNGQRMFSRSGLHAQKQLYFSSTRIIPNSPNADMRCQLSHIICRLYI